MKSEIDLHQLARQWGASALPFTRSVETDWLVTSATRGALERLNQSATLRSVMLLSGPNGVGKSALVGRWIRSLDHRLFRAISLTQATLSGSGILATLVSRMGKVASYRRERNLQNLETAIAELERRTLIVVLDEAQNYSHSSLEEVRLLLGLNLPDQPTFAMVLIGDEYLLQTLRLRHHRALYSRLSCQFNLACWSAQESRDYIEAAMRAVGLSPQCWESAALDLLIRAAGGVVRSLCLLAQAAWIAAASETKQQIQTQHVQRAIEQVPYSPGLFEAPGQPSESES